MKKEQIQGGGGQPTEGIIHGKPANQFYKQFRYVSQMGETKPEYWYLQSARVPVTQTSTTAWSVDIRIDGNPQTFQFRLITWGKNNDGQWGVTGTTASGGGKWVIKGVYLNMNRWGNLAPHASEIEEGVKFFFGPDFPVEELAGKDIGVYYTKTDRSFNIGDL